MKKKLVITMITLFLLFLVFSQIPAGRIVNEKKTKTALDYFFAEFELLSEVMFTAYTHHVDRGKFDYKKAIRGMISGYLSGYDQFSCFVDVDQVAKEKERREGILKGSIGAVLTPKKRHINVYRIVRGSPAEASGLLPKDKIVEVDGVSIKDMDLSQVVSMIKGKIGTSVKIRVFRKSANEFIDLNITRDNFEIDLVRSRIVSKNGSMIAIIEIDNFDKKTAPQLLVELQKVLSVGSKNIIFDVRNNPGGLVASVSDVLSIIMGEGRLAFSIVGTSRINVKIHTSKFPGAEVWDIIGGRDKANIVCLMNDRSASASEILVSSLRDNLNIKLIGEKTVGKGFGGSTTMIPSGKGALYVMSFRWFTPKGVCIEYSGIEPDIEVEMDEEDLFLQKDPQLDAAINELLKK